MNSVKREIRWHNWKLPYLMYCTIVHCTIWSPGLNFKKIFWTAFAPQPYCVNTRKFSGNQNNKFYLLVMLRINDYAIGFELFLYIFIGLFHTINYNIENWVWKLGSNSRHSVLLAVRLLHHRRTESSSGGSSQQTRQSADVEVHQVLW